MRTLWPNDFLNLRGKRRWFGVVIDSRFQTRLDLENSIDFISQEFAFHKKLRLMDFYNSNNKQSSSLEVEVFDDFPFRPFGLAIIEVPLEYSSKFEIGFKSFNRKFRNN